eukprot:TRINITY_DN60895_c0_g1_i1.p1 TRINITY_DN60895_c0_g1~~TRINITY_DN60895_c0_g1_i1.p1  ORF type:complete len:165 (-),score=5.75 TRINITY_DN60895_c0_g1_i1:81-575(-)
MIDDQEVLLQIWDTSGQERFQSLGVAYFRGTDAVLYVFDCTSAESFKNLTAWHDEFVLQHGQTVPAVLVATKCDLVDKRQVSKASALEWCAARGSEGTKLAYYEVSARFVDGECTDTHLSSLDAPFLDVAKRALELQHTSDLFIPDAVDIPPRVVQTRWNCCSW